MKTFFKKERKFYFLKVISPKGSESDFNFELWDF